MRSDEEISAAKTMKEVTGEMGAARDGAVEVRQRWPVPFVFE